MQVTGASRRLAIWGAVISAAVVPATALAQGGHGEDGDGMRRSRHGHGHGDGLSVVGRAMSRGEAGAAGMEIRAHRSEDTAEEPGMSMGWVRFGQRSEGGAMGLEGEVTCLLRDADGVVQVTGTVRRGGAHTHSGQGGGDPSAQPTDDPQALLDGILGDAEPQGQGDSPRGDGEGGERHGGELAGKDFAFTIDVPGEPQHFSTPRVADAGTLSACSGGEGNLEVTRGGFRTTRTEGNPAGRHGRHHEESAG